MKKLFGIVSILLVITMLPVVVFAQTQEEWNRAARKKTKCSTTVWRIVGDEKVYETIPANTYCVIDSSVGDNEKLITYMVNGVKKSGVIDASCLVSVTSSYRGSDGMAHEVHELDPEHDSTLAQNEVITIAQSQLYYGTTDYSEFDFSTPDSPTAQAAQTTAGRSASKKENEQGTVNSKIDQEEVQVSLAQLGTHTSQVVYKGTTTKVPTAELSFSSNVPEEKRIASVFAPRTGKASLRATASSSADVIKKCKSGTIVAVLEYGEKFCMINYDGSVGYVLTSCLRFHTPDESPISTGILTYKGKATGSTTINIRTSADGDSAKIAEWRTGTEVLVFTKDNNWYEVEANGKRGYVKAEFLTLVGE